MPTTNRWVLLSVIALAMAATTSVSGQTTPAAPQVRTDGVYYLCVYSNPGEPDNPVCQYVRFFADTSGLMALSADKPEQVVRWLTKENRTGEQGWYMVSGSKLTLTVPLPNGSRTLSGELTSDGWMKDPHYSFFAPPPVGEIPASSENRLPIVAGEISVKNSVEFGMTGRQEGLTTTVSINASDADGDPLTFAWKASNGSLSPSGNKVVWRRPVNFGRAEEGLLVVQVEDGKGGKTTRAWLMH